VRRQPPGYRDGEAAATDEGFAAAVSQTFRGYLSVWSSLRGLDPSNPALDFLRLLPLDAEARQACPVHVIDDLERVGLAPGAIRLIMSIRAVEETEDFSKMLKVLPPHIQADWVELKERIKEHLPAPPRFEKLRPPFERLFSLRLRRGYRVHIELPERGSQVWRAVAIGTHDRMGHG
jgi:hypothetical protein